MAGENEGEWPLITLTGSAQPITVAAWSRRRRVTIPLGGPHLSNSVLYLKTLTVVRPCKVE